MKRLLLALTAFIFLAQISFAQAPVKFNYQAAVRNGSGAILANQNVQFRISILKTSASGSSVFSETHSLTTSAQGIANMVIGSGILVSGSITNIDWASDSYFLKTELDPAGGTSFTEMGTVQLISVPYALYAEKSGMSTSDNDTSATNELQNLSFNAGSLSISNGNSVQIPDSVNDADADPANEIQSLSFSTDTLFLSGSNFVVIPDSVNDADSNPTNEIQTLSLSNDTLFLSNGGFTKIPGGTSLFASSNTTTVSTGVTDLVTLQVKKGRLVHFSGFSQRTSPGNQNVFFTDGSNSSLTVTYRTSTNTVSAGVSTPSGGVSSGFTITVGNVSSGFDVYTAWDAWYMPPADMTVKIRANGNGNCGASISQY